jgi:hypothetical protein
MMVGWVATGFAMQRTPTSGINIDSIDNLAKAKNLTRLLLKIPTDLLLKQTGK